MLSVDLYHGEQATLSLASALPIWTFAVGVIPGGITRPGPACWSRSPRIRRVVALESEAEPLDTGVIHLIGTVALGIAWPDTLADPTGVLTRAVARSRRRTLVLE